MTAATVARLPVGPIGVWSMELRTGDPDAVRQAARDLEDQGWGAIWIPGAAGPGIWSDVDRLLSATRHLPVATGVTSIWGTDGSTAAAAYKGLVAKHGDRVLPGFGISSPESAVAAGATPTTALKDMSAYLDSLDEAGGIPAQRRLLGALGPRMSALAARRAAGVHPFLVNAESHAETRRVVGQGLIAPQLGVVINPNLARARETVRRQLGFFFGFPAYRRNLLRLGFSENDLANGGSDRLIDAVAALGPVDQVAARIQEHLKAGADHVAVQVLTEEPGLPVREWQALAEATRDLR
jgi:probable F420-dependent oxidoreductase